MFLYYLVFFTFLAAIVLCSRGVISSALSACREVDIPLYTLSLVLGVPLFLLLFSLIARLVPAYQFAIPLTLGSLLLLGYLFSIRTGRASYRVERADRICMSFFGLLALPCYLLRIHWPAIHWENSVQRIGVERMFNLSLQQSFLRAKGWPVDNLWLYGEPLDYHVLLRALSGLTSWIVHALTGDAMSGGVIYLLTDVFYLCLAPTALVAFVSVVVPLIYPSAGREFRVHLLAAFFALLAFLTPNAKALSQALQFMLFGIGSDDFWFLQHAVVPGTVSYFPYGLLLSGESHSYAQAPFLSVAWLGLSVVYVLREKRWTLTALLAALGAMITQSHPATAMVCGLVSLPLFLWDTLAPLWNRSAHRWRNGAHSICLGVMAGILLIPMYREHLPPQMKWVFVDASVVSALSPFLSVHLFSSCCLLFGVVLLITPWLRDFAVNSCARDWRQGLRLALGLVLICVSTIVFAVRPVIATALAYLVVVALLIGSKRPVPLLVLGGAFLLWIFPEVAVTDWVYDNRIEWIRFNTAMRLWLESSYLFPLAVLLLVMPELVKVIASRRIRFVVGAGAGAFLIAVITSLTTLTAARMDRAPELRSVDGYDFLRVEYPGDFELISYLNQLPGHVVLGEACGDGSHPQLPYHYGMPGRIAAFSGRPSLCGWARHTWMFQQRLRRANLANETVWQSFLSTGESLKALYLSGDGRTFDAGAVQRALTYLQQRGVTHLVVGALERTVYPSAEPLSIAQAIGGRVIFAPAVGIGVLELPR